MNAPKQDIWFPAKKRGFGWGPPVRWQGWAVVAVYCVSVATAAFLKKDHPVSFIIIAVIATSLFMLVCWWKGESPRRPRDKK